MRLSNRTISDLAELICGAAGGGGFKWDNFPYRSSSALTQFFRNCDLEYEHDGSTRKFWVEEVLDELNRMPPRNPSLPSDPIIRVIQELLDPVDFERACLDRIAALRDLNSVLSRDGLEAFLDDSGAILVRNTGTRAVSGIVATQARPLTQSELSRKAAVEEYLSQADEESFIEDFLAPMFRALGFTRITPTGHRDRTLEFGNDLWMKLLLPTGHWIYFGSQVKAERIHASSSAKYLPANIGQIISQVHMILRNPIFDPDTNRKHLLDHVFIISTGEITKHARHLLATHLDQEARRHILFMERADIVNLALYTGVPLPTEGQKLLMGEQDDEFPF